jgi:hypothetical protein
MMLLWPQLFCNKSPSWLSSEPHCTQAQVLKGQMSDFNGAMAQAMKITWDRVNKALTKLNLTCKQSWIEALSIAAGDNTVSNITNVVL